MYTRFDFLFGGDERKKDENPVAKRATRQLNFSFSHAFFFRSFFLLFCLYTLFLSYFSLTQHCCCYFIVPFSSTTDASVWCLIQLDCYIFCKKNLDLEIDLIHPHWTYLTFYVLFPLWRLNDFMGSSRQCHTHGLCHITELFWNWAPISMGWLKWVAIKS
jgi:Na+/melibiose symporter-like transporter